MENNRYYEQAGVAMTCRSYAEYERMFGLEEEALTRGPVLDIASGASSFAAEARERAIEAYAADPLYRMSPEQLFEHGMKEIDVSTSKLTALRDVYDWSFYGSPESHREARERSLNRFIGHYGSSSRGAGNRVYAAASLPQLPFATGTFGLVLCSHFLFLYEEQFDYAFHLAGIQEMLRVAASGGEVRIYPVTTFKGERYPHLDTLLGDIRGEADCELIIAGLPFIPGSTHMLRAVKK